LQLPASARDGERRERLEAAPIAFFEGRIAGPALETSQPEERPPLVQEENDRVREPVGARFFAKVRKADALALGPQLVRGIRPSRRRDDALAIEAEGQRERDPALSLERLALAVDDTRRVGIGSRVVRTEEAEGAGRGDQIAHGVDHPPSEARPRSGKDDLELRCLELIHALCPILQSWPL
jgi:hypothetical protein